MLRRIWTILRETVNEWLEDNATRLSAALAFYTILSVTHPVLRSGADEGDCAAHGPADCADGERGGDAGDGEGAEEEEPEAESGVTARTWAKNVPPPPGTVAQSVIQLPGRDGRGNNSNDRTRQQRRDSRHGGKL
jgi:hypothetical protein